MVCSDDTLSVLANSSANHNSFLAVLARSAPDPQSSISVTSRYSLT